MAAFNFYLTEIFDVRAFHQVSVLRWVECVRMGEKNYFILP